MRFHNHRIDLCWGLATYGHRTNPSLTITPVANNILDGQCSNTKIIIIIFSYLPGGRARKALIRPPPTPTTTRGHPRVPSSQACLGRLAWRPKVSIASIQNARFTQKRTFCGHQTHGGCKGGRRPPQGGYERAHA